MTSPWVRGAEDRKTPALIYAPSVQVTESAPREQGLQRQLSAGQMAMVAVGGSIGTGLLLGSAAAIEVAGPAVILTFLLAAFITWTVTLALGELASRHPAAGAFRLYGELYLNEWAGFLSGAGYWAAIAISIGAEMVARALERGASGQERPPDTEKRGNAASGKEIAGTDNRHSPGASSPTPGKDCRRAS